jgi:nitroreductase
MGIFDTIKDMRSIRTYKGERIPKDKLEKLLEAARLAPSAGNWPNWKFIVIENEQIKNQLVTASNNQCIKKDYIKAWKSCVYCIHKYS